MPRKRLVYRVLGTALATTLAAGTLPSCMVIHLIVQAAKKRSTNMDRWEVNSMELGLRAQSVCPRGKVQLAVFTEAQLKKRSKRTKALETWIDKGRQTNKFGTIGFEEFAFTASNGTVDPATGWFAPNPDMLATVDGFAMTAKYKRNQKLEATSVTYPPDYSCFTIAGRPGAAGEYGRRGDSGKDGRSGGGGSDETPGTSGTDGGAAGNAGNGKDGARGPDIVAYATIVKTPLFDRLVLIQVTGDVEDTVLLDPAGPITVTARGGAGGAGGAGGKGGSGGSGGSGNGGGHGGNGGPGGVGGVGGRGGDGGSVRLVYDPEFPELGSIITVDASGGGAGPAGRTGEGGRGGFAGNGRGSGGKSGKRGEDGSEGSPGSPGAPGGDGTASIEAGDVSAAFGSLPPNVQRIAG